MSVRRGLLAALFLALAGCPKPGATGPTGPGTPDRSLDLPDIPAKLDPVRSEPLAGNDASAKSKLIGLMAEENARWFAALGKQNLPAYYVAYTIHERRGVGIEAEGGVLLGDDDDTQRALDVDVRVGDPKLDNSHALKDEQLAALTTYQHLAAVPFGDDDEAIRHSLWLETDRRYREGVTLYGLVQTQERVRAGKAASPDFSHAPAETYFQPQAKLDFDHDAWVKRLRDCSKHAATGVATRSTCRVDFELNTVYFVNSEGSLLQTSWTNARFMVQVGVKADDGMPLSRLEQAFAPSPAELPDDAHVAAMIKAVNTDLDALHKAPVMKPYSGPAILEGRAAAVFFHEVFGHRIEGHRQKDETEGKTFASYVGQRIMPTWLSVYDDPTIYSLNGMPLNGFYRFDDEGVRAQRASLVEAGVLKGFLMGRNPIPGFPLSNGHGRGEPGAQAVARQGNLVVEAQKSVTKDELYQQLIAEVKRQGKPYGLIFTDINGGFTNTSKFLPQAFKVQPVVTYRLYPDGKKEVVRGVDITGSPLTALDNIMSAARPIETFNGVCGAESGWVPVSASAPSLLIRTLEVESGEAGSDRAPVLPPPSIRGSR